MTDEIKQETVTNSQWSISPDFAKFLLMILGSFIGCLIALCLFSAVIRPPEKPYCPMMPPRYDAPYYHYRGEFRPGCPCKKQKMDAPRKDVKAPAKQAPKQDKK